MLRNENINLEKHLKIFEKLAELNKLRGTINLFLEE
jgi:hypothetical protein